MAEALATPLDRKEKSPEALETLNFKVTPAFKKEYKGYAVSQGVTMAELFREGFELSKKKRKSQ